ncbi:hypothetical protein [Paenibacillus sp. 1011MAR3C5]|uniref:hypothetical protein n=1 Tax=Paenibacillus sp. 1011MAR3C5 TaxID=1675787 RepID=UPI0016021AFD|nr:hypothetical protein [Paenibacillus sp. 1011MAR3C5]
MYCKKATASCSSSLSGKKDLIIIIVLDKIKKEEGTPDVFLLHVAYLTSNVLQSVSDDVLAWCLDTM